MAGPLIRVDTDGRGTLLKMTAGEAAKYVASHAGASIWGAKPVAAEPDTAQFVEPAEAEAKPKATPRGKSKKDAEPVEEAEAELENSDQE